MPNVIQRGDVAVLVGAEAGLGEGLAVELHEGQTVHSMQGRRGVKSAPRLRKDVFVILRR